MSFRNRPPEKRDPMTWAVFENSIGFIWIEKAPIKWVLKMEHFVGQEPTRQKAKERAIELIKRRRDNFEAILKTSLDCLGGKK